MLVGGERPAANICHVLSQRSSRDTGYVSVFLYELGRECLEDTEQVADDEQLTVNLSASAKAYHRDRQLVTNEAGDLRRYGLDQEQWAPAL